MYGKWILLLAVMLCALFGSPPADGNSAGQTSPQSIQPANEEPSEETAAPAQDEPASESESGASDELSASEPDDANAEPREVPSVKLLISARDGLYAMAADRTLTKLSTPGNQIILDTWGDKIYAYSFGRIMEIDEQGEVLRTITVPEDANGYGFTALPDNRFAVINNVSDAVYVIDSDGALVQTVPMRDEPDESGQSTAGVVVDNKLVVCSDGRNRILSIDLETFETTVLRDFSDVRLLPHSFAHADSGYYIGSGGQIQRFRGDSELEEVANVDIYNMTDIAIVEDFAFCTLNFGGSVMAFDLRTGESHLVVDGLNRPSSVVALDVGTQQERSLPEVRLMISARDGLYGMSADRMLTKLETPGNAIILDTWGDHIYAYSFGRIMEIDEQGDVLRTITVPEDANGYGFTALPDNRFAVIDNVTDEVCILDSEGALVNTVPMRDEPDESGQSTVGVVVDNNLVVCSDGSNRILSVDLETFETSVLNDFSGVRLIPHSFAHADSGYYIGSGGQIQRFRGDSELEEVANVDVYNMTDIAIVDDFAFCTFNFGGSVMAFDLQTGESQLVVEGLNRPDHLIVLDDRE